MDRVQVNKDCFQCRYGSEEIEEANAWCYEACRKIDDMSSIRKIGEDDVSSDEKEQMEIEFESIEMVSVVS